MALVIASSVTTWSIIVTTVAMATSASIIAIVIIVIATMGGIELSAVALVFASIIIFCPFLFVETIYMAFCHYIGPCKVYRFYCYLYDSRGSNYLHLHTGLPVQGEGEVVEVAVVVLLYLYFSFLPDLLYP